MNEKNPISPHIQIYNWHISSLVSIVHRITGVINITLVTIICFLVMFLMLGPNNYSLINIFFNSIYGKFVIIFITWSFSFQILSEVRHFFWDLGYGFELKTSNLTGVFVIVGSFLTTLLIYFIGRFFI